MRLKPFYTTFCWPTLFTVVGVSLLLGLGTWQLKRLEWKEALIQRITDHLKHPAKPLESVLGESLKGLEEEEYQKITATGTFLYEQEMKLMGRSYEGAPGFRLITPLILNSGALVLVDRGWVPEQAKPVDIDRPESVVEIKGLIRLKQKRNFFTPANDFEKNELYSIDPAEIAIVKNFTTLLPFYIIAYSMTDEKRYPKAEGPEIRLPNLHLQYAITWYVLALALAMTYILYIRRRLKARQHKKTK